MRTRARIATISTHREPTAFGSLWRREALQDRFNARVILGAADWTAHKSTQTSP